MMQTIVEKTKEKGAGLWASFKKFAFKGNVIDMAVGVIIGGAFSKIVTSLVNDLVMPLIGMLTAGQDFKELKWVLSAAVVENGEVVKPEAAVMYGNFLQNVLDFFLVAITVFIAVKILTFRREKKEREAAAEAERKKAEEEAAAALLPKEPTELELLKQIRDLLAEKK